MEKFNEYTFEDFLDDLSFIRFVKNRAEGNDDAWQTWIAGNPPNLAAYEQARRYVITVMSVKPVMDTPGNQAAVWVRINEQIVLRDKQAKRIKRIRAWTISSAAALLLFACGLWYLTSKVVIRTGFGEQLVVTLPDSSIIHLNANSTISYYRAWALHSEREAWLNGEGYFQVNHLNKHPGNIKASERFVAHAGNIDIQVLGTEFNIKNRRNTVTVSLIKGKIGISNRAGGRRLILSPGQAIEFHGQRLVELPIIHMENQPLAWTRHEMVVNGMTVADIINNYEDIYGGHIVLENKAKGSIRIDGTISLYNKESTIYMLANLLNATVEYRDNNTYYLKNNQSK